MAAVVTSGGEGPLVVGLREMAKGLGAARDSLPFITDPGVLGDALCELTALETEIDSFRLQLIGQAESNGVPASIDVRTVGQYVAARTNHAGIDADQDSKLNKWLRDFPVLADGLERADITVRHLLYVKTRLDNVRTSSALRADQEQFVVWARDCGFKNFKKACAYWLVRVDPDGEEPIDQLDSNGVTIKYRNGDRCRITIDTDVVSGSMFKTMIEHESEKIRESDREEDVVRTVRQRRHAALFALAERGFRRDDGTHPTPLLNVVMSLSVAEWALNQLQNPTAGHVPVDPFDSDGRCELIDGTPVHPLLIAAACGLHRFTTADLRRYVMTAQGRIVDYSYNARVAPEHLRTASMIEHRGECATAGCEAPHSWLQMDHTDPHSNGGKTRLRNMQPLCRPDNQAKGATTGHQAWKDRPPPTRHKPSRSDNNDDGDAA